MGSITRRRREAQEAIVDFIDEPTNPHDLLGYLTDHRPSDLWVAIHNAIREGQIVQDAHGMLVRQTRQAIADEG